MSTTAIQPLIEATNVNSRHAFDWNRAFLRLTAVMVLATVAAVSGIAMAADEWPQFRGPGGDGQFVGGPLPVSWNDSDDQPPQNIVWRTPLPGLGWSSPVISGDQIWLTTATNDGLSLRALCVDRNSGELIHDVEVFGREQAGSIHAKNSHASPTPILEGDRVWVSFGDYGTACLDRQGDVLWRNSELVYEHGHGPGGSPVLVGDLLVTSCDGTDVQFVAALDKNTGELRWKSPRPGQMAYCTPLVIELDGEQQVVCPGGDKVVAYRAATGEEIWHCRYDGYSVVPRPVFAHGLVYVSSGYDSPVMLAIRPFGMGDVTDTRLAWTLVKGAPHNPSPIVIGENLYLVSDRGVLTAVDGPSGEVRWQERLGTACSASPLACRDVLYVTDEAGRTTVAKVGETFEKRAVNTVRGRTLASLAAAGRAIYLRTDTHLYKIEQ